MTSGIILVDKPAGITSFQALGRLKKSLGHRKIGHTGTLDKFASGLIVVLAGSYTRLNPYFTNLDKTYLAEFTFGQETSTLDPEGEVLYEAAVPDLDAIKKVIPSFSGEIMQIPPEFSAVHINGKRAYQRKLAGEEVKIPARKVFIESIQIISMDNNRLSLRVSCSKGTYIRSLARDIGKAAGSRAFVSVLERERVGLCMKSESVSPENFNPESDLIVGKEAFSYLPEVELRNIEDDYIGKVRNGVPFEPRFCAMTRAPEKDNVFALMHQGHFAGILEYKSSQFRYGFVVGGNG